MSALFKGTELQAEMLPFLAKEAVTLSEQAKLKPMEQLALYSIATEAQDPSSAATGLRNVALELSAARESKKKVLTDKGFDVAAFDFEGEDFYTGIRAFQASLEKLGEVEQSELLRSVFGKENISSAQLLFREIESFPERMKMVQDKANFLDTVALKTTGDAAEKVRGEAMEQFALAGAAMPELAGERFKLSGREAAKGNEINRELSLRFYDLLTFFDQQPKTAGPVAGATVESMLGDRGPVGSLQGMMELGTPGRSIPGIVAQTVEQVSERREQRREAAGADKLDAAAAKINEAANTFKDAMGRPLEVKRDPAGAVPAALPPQRLSGGNFFGMPSE